MAQSSSSPPGLFHLYDVAMRSWAESNPAGVAGWLDPSVSGVPAEDFVMHPTALIESSLSVPLMHADLMIGVGSQRLMHVEYETSPGSDLVPRMYDYRGRIMRRYPGRRLTQHVIVLGDGRVKGHDDLATHGFALDLNVVYLRDHEPAECLADSFLALFAALSRGSCQVRERSFGAAMQLLLDSDHPMAWAWLMAAKSVAEIRLERSTIDRIGRENVMAVHPYVERFREEPWAQELIKQGREQGREQGWEQGQADGVMQGGERVLLAIIRTRFGYASEAEAIARMLSGWDDADAAVAAINAASDPATLLAQGSQSAPRP